MKELSKWSDELSFHVPSHPMLTVVSPLTALKNYQIEAPFTSREGNPSARVDLAGGSKIARVYKQNFTGRVTLPHGTT